MNTNLNIKKVNRPPTLKEVVINRLREDICRGNFQPGQSLSEIKVAELLNVSRGTIREALLHLKDEGLVELTPHRGFSLTKLSIHKAWEIYSLRSILEPYAARLAVENKSFKSEDINMLTSLVKILGEDDNKTSFYDKVKADLEFHEVIYRGCNNSLLLSILKSIRSLMFLFILTTNISYSDRIKVDQSHAEILDAIISNSPDDTEKILRKHIIDTGEALIATMERYDKR